MTPRGSKIINFTGLDGGSLALCAEALADAPPMDQAQIDVLSSLFGLAPVDLDVGTERELLVSAAAR